MASIDIRRPHGRSLKAAKTAVDKVANAIGSEFGIACEWNGNDLEINRSGVHGKIAVDKHEVHVTAELGFLMGAMKPVIQREIERHLDEQFGAE